eukprot:TRINITY_DN91020_c0_g1_i1.p1 TRINITY_DN91020_c0_g1~~TRINITY_DN91020_c0_g1_i1.p1  ORF type:complete len:379 (+),score=64.64 TRINITY_DN91020_c0_g1_i1:125-1261(+)
MAVTTPRRSSGVSPRLSSSRGSVPASSASNPIPRGSARRSHLGVPDSAGRPASQQSPRKASLQDQLSRPNRPSATAGLGQLPKLSLQGEVSSDAAEQPPSSRRFFKGRLSTDPSSTANRREVPHKRGFALGSPMTDAADDDVRASERKPSKGEKGDSTNASALALSRKLMLEFDEVKGLTAEWYKIPPQPDGSMKIDDFRSFLCRAFGIASASERIVMNAFFEADLARGEMRAGDEKLEKFLHWYKKNLFTAVATLRNSTQATKGARVLNGLIRNVDLSEEELTKIAKQFNKYDADGSGAIDYCEFCDLLRDFLGVTSNSDIPEQRLKRFWNEIDNDGNGEVDIKEFAMWYAKYFSSNSGTDLITAFYQSHMHDFNRR